MVTTIQLKDETKEKIASFGSKKDTYDDIINRIYDMAVKTQLRDFLMSSEDSISLEEARKELDKKWPR
jgi:hypothetical protein